MQKRRGGASAASGKSSSDNNNNNNSNININDSIILDSTEQQQQHPSSSLYHHHHHHHREKSKSPSKLRPSSISSSTTSTTTTAKSSRLPPKAQAAIVKAKKAASNFYHNKSYGGGKYAPIITTMSKQQQRGNNNNLYAFLALLAILMFGSALFLSTRINANTTAATSSVATTTTAVSHALHQFKNNNNNPSASLSSSSLRKLNQGQTADVNNNNNNKNHRATIDKDTVTNLAIIQSGDNNNNNVGVADSSLSSSSQAAAAAAAASLSFTKEQQQQRASLNMLRQDSTWVDGEKRLKQKLLELKLRQDQGKSLGATILTRYLGEDIPVWMEKSDPRHDEWQKTVKAKYKEMAEREQWERAHHEEVAAASRKAYEEADNINVNVNAIQAKAAAAAAKREEGTPLEEEEEDEVHDAEHRDEDLEELAKQEAMRAGQKNERDETREEAQHDELLRDESNAKIIKPSKEEDNDGQAKGNQAEKGGEQQQSPQKAARAEDESKVHIVSRNYSQPQQHTYLKPSEMAGPDAVVILEPTFGVHRPSADAVFAFGEGYDVQTYMLLIESLRATGFDGDMVLSVSALHRLSPGVEDYLRSLKNIVVYALELSCVNGEGEVVNGTKGGIRMCQIPHLYGNVVASGGKQDGKDDKVISVIPDPREGRPVATLRYELYWAWCSKYEPHSWIMLIDSRDTLFQNNPFARLPRASSPSTTAAAAAVGAASDVKDSGILYFFGENANSTNLGASSHNRKWISRAYGKATIAAWVNKTVVCSGSTMGEQIAIDAYLRAMVTQFDESHVKLIGADQGFHNYLYYSGVLNTTEAIREIVFWEQGKGIINNVAAMRVKPLREWGVYDPNRGKVLNWDGTDSDVVHQWDRDAEFNKVVNQRKRALRKKLMGATV